MALNKSKNNQALTIHAFVYAWCFSWWGLEFACFTFLTHWATDYITSRCTSKLWFIDLEPLVVPLKDSWFDYYAHVIPKKRHWFFVVIGFDQLIHFTTLALTYKLLFGG